MQVNAEIHLGTRSVLEYLLSPVQKIAHEVGGNGRPKPLSNLLPASSNRYAARYGEIQEFIRFDRGTLQ